MANEGNVLIIEDDQLISRMYSKIFKYEGINTMIANNGKKGVEMAQEKLPDLIFCDVMMPKMSGLKVLETLKSDQATKSIPVVMLTNLSGTQDAENAMKKGAAGYLVKSEYKPKDIADKAKSYLKSILKKKGK